MKILFSVLLLLATQCFAQFGGVKAVEDTMRLENKFHAYKISDGQRFVSSNVNADTSYINYILKVPITETLPTCSSLIKGVIVMKSTDNRLYFCNGSSYGLVAYDGDLDGLTSAIDANDASAFAAGTATAPNVLTAKTFYAGPNMTETTGTMPNNGAQTFNSDGVKNAGYYSSITVDVVASGTGDTDAASGQILSGYEAWGSTGGLIDGTMPNRGSVTFNSDGVQNTGYYSGITVDVVASGTGDGDAAGGQILSGYEAWNSSGGLVDGTMPNNGSQTFNSDGVKNAGYYSGITVDVVASGTGDGDAAGGQILSGYEAWGSTGNLIDGTMPNNGSQTFNTDGTKNSGYYSSLVVDVIATGTGDVNASGGQILSGYEAWNESGSLVDGTMVNNGSQTFNSDGVKSAGYYSGITVDVVASGTADGNAGSAQILSGYEAWNSTGGLVDGTMPNNGSQTFNSDGVKSAGYYSGITVDVISAGTGDTNASSGQILSGYEAWNESGSLVDGTMANNGAGSFTADGSYSAGYYSSISVDVVAAGTGDANAGGAQILSGYEAWGSTGGLIDGTMPDNGSATFNSDGVKSAGYYSGITVDVIESGTGTTDADDAKVRSGYEYWTSSGQRRSGSLSTQAGSSNTPVSGSGSYVVATGNRYLSGDVTINRVSATATINHGQTASSGPYQSVTCNSASTGFSVTGPTAGSSGTDIGLGNQITINANDGSSSSVYHCSQGDTEYSTTTSGCGSNYKLRNETYLPLSPGFFCNEKCGTTTVVSTTTGDAQANVFDYASTGPETAGGRRCFTHSGNLPILETVTCGC